MKTKNATIKASPVEAMMDGLGSIINMYLCAVLDFQEKIDFPLLQKSLYALYLEEPVIGARYNRKNRRSQWIIDPDPKWECAEYNNIDENKAQLIEEGFIQKPEPYVNEIPVSLHLLHLDSYDRLIIRINHLLTDAGGIKTFLYRLCENYTTLKADPEWIPEKSNKRCRPGLLKAVRISNIGKVLRGMKDDMKTTKPVPGFFIPMSDNEPHNGTIASLHLDPARVTRLREKWKKENITLNDILLCAFSSAVYKSFYHVDNQINIMRLYITSDLRKYVPQESYIGNLSMNTTIDTEDMSQFSPHQYLHYVSSQTRKWKQHYSGLGAAIMSNGILKILPDKIIRNLLKGAAASITFTNMGLLDNDKLSLGNTQCINARINPPLGLPPSFIAGATGFEDTITFCYGYWASAFKHKNADMLMKEMDEQLSLLE